jgi:coenzyme Q-binding protein COQ10
MPSYTERRRLRYTLVQLFDLVADIEQYPRFVPWVRDARVRRREGDTIWVDMEVGSGPIRRRFGSKAELTRPTRIEIGSDDTLFERFRQTWSFEPADGGGTWLEYRIDYRLRSRLLALVLDSTFEDNARSIVAAFRRRARQIYGQASASGRHGQQDAG